MRRLMSAALLAMVAGCGPSQPGRTGSTLVDACLHWTACTTPPASLPPSAYSDNLASCTLGFELPPGGAAHLPWSSGGIAVTPTQLDCIAAAGLDCARALDCVAPPSPVDCALPTWSCDGDTLRRCDQFAGARVVSEDCAAEGLHCVPVANEARCGLSACDPKTFVSVCSDNRIEGCQPVFGADGAMIGGVVLSQQDCSAHDATCTVASNGVACVGNGPACTFAPPNGALSCDGDVLVACDTSGHQERSDCAALGLRCVMLSPNPGGFTLACASARGLVVCTEGPTFGQCDGTKLEYCDDEGNEQLDCKSLGYRDCAGGRCVP